MTLDEFFAEDWTVSGINNKGIELESADESKHLWIELESIMTLLHKLHLQYEDDDLEMLLEHDGKDT